MTMVMFQAHNWPRVIGEWPNAGALAGAVDSSTGAAGVAEGLFSEWRERLERARSAVIDFGETTEATRRAGQLTEKGQREAAANLVERRVMPVLSALRAMLVELDEREAGIRAQVAERLTPAARTPTEVQVRSEVRFHVRDMNAPERAKFLMDHSDPVTVAALMEAPAYLCGLTEADRRRMLDANLTEREGLMLSMIEGARQIARDVLVGAWAVAEGPLDAEARASFAEVLGVKPSPIRRGETVAA